MLATTDEFGEGTSSNSVSDTEVTDVLDTETEVETFVVDNKRRYCLNT